MTKTYLIPVLGVSGTLVSQWRFAIEKMGYSVLSVKSIFVDEPMTLLAKSRDHKPGDGFAETTLSIDDELIVLVSDAPGEIISALWAMTGNTCAFIAETFCDVDTVADLGVIFTLSH